jgi:2-methylcitrate dehydratase PrpD
VVTLSEGLASWSERLRFSDLPPKVVDQVNLHLCDYLGLGCPRSPRPCRTRT